MAETLEKRSRIMRAVKSKDTGPEMVVRRLAHGMGCRYRLHGKGLPGKPDLVFGPSRKVVFVHGCFWHGHPCKRGNRMPENNHDYWLKKIARNKERDQENLRDLQERGWQVLVIWECEVKEDALIKHQLQELLGN